MDHNEPIHTRRLLLLTIGGIAIILLAYLVSAEAAEYNVFSAPSTNLMSLDQLAVKEGGETSSR
ncbi:hypothetical protein [uncultured Endozoicomonas sp.]|uniref:hypothetical protein n=1 Tax=uncultured Endozoicomonas sp. TaxID=432652 RepID=UPI00261D41DC|nr:hypothetical protein [uncultured Endozoicomonas sp.]